MMKNYWGIAAAIACVPGVAAAQDFDGARVEARIGYETPTVSEDNDVYKIGSAASYGGEIGFDFKANKVVVGPYVNYEFSSVELCDGGDCLGEKGNLSAGARIGVIVGNRGLVYAKAGYANIEFEVTSGTASASESKSGVQGGLGFEFGLGKFYGFVEGSYADYGKFYGINLQRRQVAGGVGIRF
jgi:outer membrane immunogenic protein